MSPDRRQQYYERQYRYRPARESLSRMRSNLRGMQVWPGMRIVDVGCGSGAAGSYLSSQGAAVVGMDLAFAAVHAVSSEDGTILLLQGNAESLPLASHTFDGALLMGTLEHFDDPGQALLEVKRVLKPGGQVCLVVPNSRFFLFRFLGGTGQPHEVPRTRAGWQALFETAGLHVGQVCRDVGPGIRQGGIVRGTLRKVVLSLFNALPLDYTYQFVFVCHIEEGGA